ncbi:MAG: alkaline phosphatase family protein [Gammaproteobacteria bacterium]
MKCFDVGRWVRGLLGSLARTGEVALALASWAALAGCVTPPAQSPAGTTANLSALPAQAGAGFSPVAQPKLVVVIVLDQFRADYLTRFAPHFSEGGFKRLLREGASFIGHYGYYATYTGPGHALLLSGSYPYINGIATNKFYNQDTGRSEAMVFDAQAQVLGLKKTDPDMDVSPRNFVGSTVGDELFLATGGRSKTIALATKGRGAILLGGRLGKTYWMNDSTGEMTTSTYYAKKLPAWVRVWNQKKFADSFFGKQWERALPESAYAISQPDDSETEGGGKGLGKTFPHIVDGTLTQPGPDFYAAFAHTPFANDYEFDFAKAAVEGERLGARGVTDLLAISLSAIDLAGHDFGPFSQEVQDLVVRTDRQIADFLRWLESKVDQERLLVAVTADHGATPVPEQMTALGFEAGRIKKKAIKETIESALKKKFGGGSWVIALEDPHVFLDRKLLAGKKLDPAEVERTAGEAAITLKGFGGFFTRTQLARGEGPSTDLTRSILRSYYAPRGGDVVLWTLPFYFWGKYGEKDVGSTHGTYYRYDSEVPVFIAGSGIRPGRYGLREMVDLAPTLAYLLGLTAPAASEGEVIPLAHP